MQKDSPHILVSVIVVVTRMCMCVSMAHGSKTDDIDH